MEDFTEEGAISAALCGDWKQALSLNLEILKKKGENPDMLNRIARAYMELGKSKLAWDYTKKVLAIDPYNSIAKKAKEKLSLITKNGTRTSTPTKFTNVNFLEEAGRTKIVPIINLCTPSLRISLVCGEEVKLVPGTHQITVNSSTNKYIGKLPDDLGNRLIKLIKAGNIYQAFIKCSDRVSVKVFIKEIKRGPKVTHIPSFPSEKLQYIAFADPELVHDQKSPLAGTPEKLEAF